MKNLSKYLIAVAFFSLAAVSFAHAEETKTPENVPAVGKTTLENLQTAFNSANNSSAQYLAVSKKAGADTFMACEVFYRTIARAERIRSERFAELIEKFGDVPKVKIEKPVIKSLAENVEAAFKNENYKSTTLYPKFLAQAQKDNNAAAAEAFEDAARAEAILTLFLKRSRELIAEKKKVAKSVFYICPFCGNVIPKNSFMGDKCPICGEEVENFITES